MFPSRALRQIPCPDFKKGSCDRVGYCWFLHVKPPPEKLQPTALKKRHKRSREEKAASGKSSKTRRVVDSVETIHNDAAEPSVQSRRSAPEVALRAGVPADSAPVTAEAANESQSVLRASTSRAETKDQPEGQYSQEEPSAMKGSSQTPQVNPSDKVENKDKKKKKKKRRDDKPVDGIDYANPTIPFVHTVKKSIPRVVRQSFLDLVIEELFRLIGAKYPIKIVNEAFAIEKEVLSSGPNTTFYQSASVRTMSRLRKMEEWEWDKQQREA